MCENDIKKGDMSSAEIESLRQTLEGQIKEEVMTCVQASMQKTSQGTKDSSLPVEDTKKNKVRQYHWYLFLIILLLIVYSVLIGNVVQYLFSFGPVKCPDQHLCNNVCILIALVLILSTVVLLCICRYIVVMRKNSIDIAMESKAGDKKNKKEEKSLKDQMMEKAQAAILEIVVKDTIDSFKKK